MATSLGSATADVVRPYLTAVDFGRWTEMPIPLSSRLAMLQRANAPREVLAAVSEEWERRRNEPPTRGDVDAAEIEHKASAAWERAWDDAVAADKAAGRRYDKDRLAEVAHAARMDVWRPFLPAAQ